MGEREVQVTTGARVHFGIFPALTSESSGFGGLGTLVKMPSIQIRVQPKKREHPTTIGYSGLHPVRMLKTIETWRERSPYAKEFERDCFVHCSPTFQEQPIHLHVGLGIGTQLALSLVAGLQAYLLPPEIAERELAKGPEYLAYLAGRGKRSLTGTMGFCQGGLVLDAGTRIISAEGTKVESPKNLSSKELTSQTIPWPDAWRLVLFQPSREEGLSGNPENHAFGQLPQVSTTEREQFRAIVEKILQGVAENHFELASENFYQLNRATGERFASVQGGLYSRPEINDWIKWLRAEKITGVGQSSWGPTIFALLPSEDQAKSLATKLEAKGAKAVRVTIPKNDSASIDMLEVGEETKQ
ncbi:Hypothetical protein PBC10988_14270 [Planctomycetales bacterium 10988]|nr:Hypothetical protein PBC10988_14270 [Planctomycetales bacterium 10988]